MRNLLQRLAFRLLRGFNYCGVVWPLEVVADMGISGGKRSTHTSPPHGNSSGFSEYACHMQGNKWTAVREGLSVLCVTHFPQSTREDRFNQLVPSFSCF